MPLLINKFKSSDLKSSPITEIIPILDLKFVAAKAMYVAAPPKICSTFPNGVSIAS